MKFLIILLFFSMSAHAAKKPSIWVYNETTDTIIIGNDVNSTRPIASLTKLMTAIIAIDQNPSMVQQLKLSRVTKSRLPLTHYSREDLFSAMLIRSDNAAAETLAANYPGGRKAFIKAMNTKATALGMTQTRFNDPSGLSSANISTAGEIGILLKEAAKYELITSTSTKKQALIDAHYGKKIRSIDINNTNRPVLIEFDNILISKTGFTNPAGWCVALLVQNKKQQYVIVILGEANKTQRLAQVENIMFNHILDRDIN